MPGARGHAVTMAAMPFQRGIVADRILQKVCPLVRFFRRRCGRMTMGWHIRREFLSCGVRAAALVLFGTAGLSELSAFATAKWPGGSVEVARRLSASFLETRGANNVSN